MLAGSLIGGLVCVGNIYFGLKNGLALGTSFTGAILGERMSLCTWARNCAATFASAASHTPPWRRSWLCTHAQPVHTAREWHAAFTTAWAGSAPRCRSELRVLCFGGRLEVRLDAVRNFVSCVLGGGWKCASMPFGTSCVVFLGGGCRLRCAVTLAILQPQRELCAGVGVQQRRGLCRRLCHRHPGPHVVCRRRGLRAPDRESSLQQKDDAYCSYFAGVLHVSIFLPGGHVLCRVCPGWAGTSRFPSFCCGPPRRGSWGCFTCRRCAGT